MTKMVKIQIICFKQNLNFQNPLNGSKVTLFPFYLQKKHYLYLLGKEKSLEGAAKILRGLQII